MSFFLFVKQIVDMLYQYKFLDYIMVGLVLLLLVYQTALVRPDLRRWYTKADLIILLLGTLTTIGFLKTPVAYENYFKVISAFLMYFVGRIYYDRIQECYGALVSGAYLIVYLNFLKRIQHFGWDLLKVKDAGGDFYYYDTDMAFAIILAMVFIAMFGKNTVIKYLTIFAVCPYLVFYSDAGIQKILMLAVYAIILVYLTELVFRKQKLTSIVLTLMIIGMIAVVITIYLPVMGVENKELILGLFNNRLLNNSNMYDRYTKWENILSIFHQKGIGERLFGAGLDAGIPIESLYIKLLYALGYVGVLLALLLIGYITYCVVKIEDRKTFYLAVIMAVMLMGTGVTINSMECVQMSWFPLLFAGMVISSVREGGREKDAFFDYHCMLK